MTANGQAAPLDRQAVNNEMAVKARCHPPHLIMACSMQRRGQFDRFSVRKRHADRAPGSHGFYLGVRVQRSRCAGVLAKGWSNPVLILFTGSENPLYPHDPPRNRKRSTTKNGASKAWQEVDLGVGVRLANLR